MARSVLTLLVLLAVVPCLAQQGEGNECTPAGTWYGGSVVSYQMTVTPAGPAGHYNVTFQGMYKNSVMSTTFDGTVAKNGKAYEGALMALTTQDPVYLTPPPYTNLPDITAGWFSMELVDCNTLRNTIPFLGLYAGGFIWKPGTPWTGIGWAPNAKVPLISPPDLDLIPILTGDLKPIVETYHRLKQEVNPALLHH